MTKIIINIINALSSLTFTFTIIMCLMLIACVRFMVNNSIFIQNKTLMNKNKSCFFIKTVTIGAFFVFHATDTRAFSQLWSTDNATQPASSGKIVVKFMDTAPPVFKEMAAARNGFEIVEEFENTGLAILEAEGQAFLSAKTGRIKVAQAIDDLNNSPIVEYAEPDSLWRIDSIPNDPLFIDLWGLHNTGQTGGTEDADIDAPEAWDIITGDSDMVVAVIDTGVDYNHEDLAANMWLNPMEIAGNGLDDDGNGYIDDIHGIDTYNSDGDPMDDHFHGTHCSGTIGGIGNNGIGITGICWRVRIMALKFIGSSGTGYTSGAIECINYVIMMKNDYGIDIKVINNSWGGSNFSQALYDAIEAAKAAGILFVASAGNSSLNNDTFPHYPSSFTNDNIIAVASTDHNDNLSPFSCYGTMSVDLAAPGSNILSTLPNNNYGSISGTSMAAPNVSGAVSLISAMNPQHTWEDIKSVLLDNTDYLPPLSGKVVTGGRLNINKTIAPLVPTILIMTPGTGTLFNVGDVIEVRWRNYFVEEFPNIKIEFSSDGGDTFTTIEKSIANVGEYVFIAPSVESYECVVRVSDAEDGVPECLTKRFSVQTFTAVELIYFDAIAINHVCVLEWETAAETNNAGFNIYRSVYEDDDYIQINTELIPAEGSVIEGALYRYIDEDVNKLTTYYYLLETVNLNGLSTLSDPVWVTPRLVSEME